jgi:hypothetical protein
MNIAAMILTRHFLENTALTLDIIARDTRHLPTRLFTRRRRRDISRHCLYFIWPLRAGRRGYAEPVRLISINEMPLRVLATLHAIDFVLIGFRRQIFDGRDKQIAAIDYDFAAGLDCFDDGFSRKPAQLASLPALISCKTFRD